MDSHSIPVASFRHSLLDLADIAGSALWPLRATLYPRRFHAYSVGAAKSGTHSIAGILATKYRSVHEARNNRLIRTIASARSGHISADTLQRVLRQRDRLLWLEMDSSQLNYFILEHLLQEFPNARFVLTIREPLAWLDSLINHQLSRPIPPLWKLVQDWRFGAKEAPLPKEKVLVKHNLYSLDGYLSYWALHNQRVLDLVPPDRLLIIRTDHISDSGPQLARFLGISPDTLDLTQTHLYQAKQKFRVLDDIDKSYLFAKVQLHCSALLEQFFPESHSFKVP